MKTKRFRHSLAVIASARETSEAFETEECVNNRHIRKPMQAIRANRSTSVEMIDMRLNSTDKAIPDGIPHLMVNL